MFYSIDGKIVKLEGGFPQRKVNSLTLKVDDSGFPVQNSGNQSGFGIASLTPISIIVISGNEQFVLSNDSQYQDGYYYLSITSDGLPINGFNTNVSSGLFSSLVFQNSTGSTKSITIAFQNISKISFLRFANFNLYDNIPSEIIFMASLQKVEFQGLKYVENFPSDFRTLKLLTEITLSNIGNTFNKIPDSFFDIPLKRFQASSTFNLSNFNASNAFKINQWTNLESLRIEECKISNFPNDFVTFKNTIKDLRINGSELTEFPSVISQYHKLERLYINVVDTGQIIDFCDFSLVNSLKFLWLIGNFKISTISQDWVGLKSLQALQIITTWISNSIDFNLLIEQMYLLVIQNAFVNPASPEALADDYPNQFRNISWGHGSLAVDTPIEVHPDYVTGQFFGAAQTNGQRVYELIDNYGHTITHA